MVQKVLLKQNKLLPVNILVVYSTCSYVWSGHEPFYKYKIENVCFIPYMLSSPFNSGFQQFLDF